MGIQRYLFFSIHNCDKHAEVPLMRIKHATEKFLQQSGLNYTTLRLCGFMQVFELYSSCMIGVLHSVRLLFAFRKAESVIF